MIWKLHTLVASAMSITRQTADGSYVPARPYPGPFTLRIRAAWLVLTGKADAVIWPDGQ